MERSGYWRVYGKCWQKDHRLWHSRDPEEKNGAFESAPAVYYGGRIMDLESYLTVPTFLRLGRRPAE